MKLIVDCITFYLIVLFLYTSFNKIITFDVFQHDLHRNPLIGQFYIPISIILPISEIIVAFALLFQRNKRFGWSLSILLMTLFTLYVGAIIFFVPYKKMPCSCGGVIRLLSWIGHLWFNLASTAVAVVGYRLSLKSRSEETPTKELKGGAEVVAQ